MQYENAFLYREAQREITDRKQTEKLLQYQNFHDTLTGLYNRTYFEEEMQRIDKRSDGSVGLIMLDLDGLKLVNDTLGHDQGMFCFPAPPISCRQVSVAQMSLPGLEVMSLPYYFIR